MAVRCEPLPSVRISWDQVMEQRVECAAFSQCDLHLQIPPQRDRSFRNSVTAVSASVTADSDLIVTDFDGSSE